MQKYHFIWFLFVVFSVFFLMHLLVYQGIVRGLSPSPQWRKVLRIFFILAAASFFIGRSAGHHHALLPIAVFGSFWLGIISIAFTIFIIQFILILILPKISRQITFIALFLLFIASTYSVINVLLPPRLKELAIPVQGLPAELEGLSIVQLSDLHLDGFKTDKMLHRVINTVNSLNADVIVFTGDLIDREITRGTRFCSALKRLKSRFGAFAVPGNHEFYVGINKFLELTEGANITVLRNNRVTIADGIELAGIEDEAGKRITGGGPDLEAALSECDFNKPVILLSHRPKGFEKAAQMGVDLQLSGHTHAGQIPPMDLLVFFIYKYPYGLKRYKTSHIYTTCGTGIWGPPMRLFSRSEIVKIVLFNNV